MTTRSVPAGSAVSACQTIAGARPETSRSARAMSRSRLIPGKTTTADFILALAGPVVFGAGLLSQIELEQNLNPIILDHRVGEELFGGVPQRRLGAGAIGAFDLYVEHLALAHAGDAVDAERAQRALDGLALRIENAGLQRNGNACLHVQPLSSSPAPDRCRPAARSP